MSFLHHVYEILGEPSWISRILSVAWAYLFYRMKKNKTRDDFIDKIMEKKLADSKDLEIINAKIEGVSKRIDDLNNW